MAATGSARGALPDACAALQRCWRAALLVLNPPSEGRWRIVLSSSHDRGLRAGRAAPRDIRTPISLLAFPALSCSSSPGVTVRLGDLDELHDLRRPDGATSFVGLENYRQQLADREFWRAALVTVVYTGVTTAAKLALDSASRCCWPRPFRGRAVVFLAIFLPWAYPASVSVIGWYWTLNRRSPPPIRCSW